MFGLDVCGVHSVCSFYEVSGLVAFVAPMGRWDWTLVVYSINSIYGHWGWMFGASTAFVLSLECFGLDFWGVHSICSVSAQTFRLVFYLFIYFSCDVACSVYGALGWNLCGCMQSQRL